ncbi:MAG: serine/threonine-protein phosphatase [Alphaproteobacteria bacterium]|nr:MAG: serine/threonine-protein phosphatase [Alphaproteobacteria bacterium]
MPCRSAARTHVGTVRRRNEDAVLERAEIGLWAVADGAGGHERGDFASSRIIAALRRVDPALSGLSLVEEVKGSLAEVNREVRAKAATIGPNALIGSTVAVLLIWGDQYCCLWAGDSRLYRMRASQLRQLTRDQSHVQDLVDRGEILPEAAASHPMANIVTNLIGAFDRLVLEERHDRLEPGDILLLCSDGLSGTLRDTEIARILTGSPLAVAADGLIEQALARGARDNVSAVVVEYIR